MNNDCLFCLGAEAEGGFGDGIESATSASGGLVSKPQGQVPPPVHSLHTYINRDKDNMSQIWNTDGDG